MSAWSQPASSRASARRRGGRVRGSRQEGGALRRRLGPGRSRWASLWKPTPRDNLLSHVAVAGAVSGPTPARRLFHHLSKLMRAIYAKTWRWIGYSSFSQTPPLDTEASPTGTSAGAGQSCCVQGGLHMGSGKG